MPQDLEGLVQQASGLERTINFFDKHKWKIGLGVVFYSGLSHYINYIKDGNDTLGCMVNNLRQISIGGMLDCASKDVNLAKAFEHNGLADLYYMTKFIGKMVWDCFGDSAIVIAALGIPKQVIDYCRPQATKKLPKEKPKIPVAETLFFGNQRKVLTSEYYGLKGNYLKAAEVLREAETKSPNNWGIKAGLALWQTLYYASTEKDRDRMISANYQCFKMMGQRKVPILPEDESDITLNARIAKEIKKRSASEQRNRGYEIAQAVLHTIHGQYDKAIKHFEEAMDFPIMYTKEETDFKTFINGEKFDARGYEMHLLEMQRDDNQLAMLMATALNAISASSTKYSAQAKEQADKAYLNVFLRSKDDLRIRPIRLGESKNLTYVFTGVKEIEEDLVFKENSKREELEGEVKVAKEIDNIIRGYPRFDVEEPVGVFEFKEEKEQKFVYIIKRVKGDTLQNIIENNAARLDKLMPMIGEYLAIIHARVKTEKNTYNMKEDLLRKVIQIEHWQPELLAIVQNHEPITEAVKNLPALFYKDAHPDNWLVSAEDTITLIDCESKEARTCTIDLVNLLEHGNHIKTVVKENTLKKYRETLQKLSGINLDHEQFRLAYYNTVINRSLALSSSWQYERRLCEKIPDTVGNARTAIDIIRKDFSNYFTTHTKKYNIFLENIDKIKGS